MPSLASAEEALAAACTRVGLDSAGAELLYSRANAVYRLAVQPVVVRVRRTPAVATWIDRMTVSVRVTAWLSALGFPAVAPLEVEQPVAVGGFIATFWHYLEATRPSWDDVVSLGRLLRRLHELPQPPVRLPAASPLSSLREDTERCAWLTGGQRSWVLSRVAELEHQYAGTTWTLGCGMIHGDAYAENLIHTRDRVVLSDWDSVSDGPREQDIVPASIRYRFGRPKAEWDQFCAAYGVDPGDLPGLVVLRQMRELRTLVPYLRSTGHPRAQAEASRRIADLMNGTQREPWRALNLAP